MTEHYEDSWMKMTFLALLATFLGQICGDIYMYEEKNAAKCNYCDALAKLRYTSVAFSPDLSVKKCLASNHLCIEQRDKDCTLALKVCRLKQYLAPVCRVGYGWK